MNKFFLLVCFGFADFCMADINDINNIKLLPSAPPKPIIAANLYCPVIKTEDLANIADIDFSYTLRSEPNKVFLYDYLIALNFNDVSARQRLINLRRAMSIKQHAGEISLKHDVYSYIFSNASAKEIITKTAYSLAAVNYLYTNQYLYKTQLDENSIYLKQCSFNDLYTYATTLRFMFHDSQSVLENAVFSSTDIFSEN
jgi:hypothetical protein